MLWILYPRYANYPHHGTYCAIRADSEMNGAQLQEAVCAGWLIDPKKGYRLFRVGPKGEHQPVDLEKPIAESGVRYGDPLWLEDALET